MLRLTVTVFYRYVSFSLNFYIGTITSRLLGSYFGAIGVAVEKSLDIGVSANEIVKKTEKVCKRIFGMERGAFHLMDDIGIPSVRAMLVR